MTMSSVGRGRWRCFWIEYRPEPTIDLVHGIKLKLGSNEFEVRFTPGHTKGHCVLYVEKENICFCGDLIFNGSVGRTDLPCGDFNTLENNIHQTFHDAR